MYVFYDFCALCTWYMHVYSVCAHTVYHMVCACVHVCVHGMCMCVYMVCNVYMLEVHSTLFLLTSQLL